MIELHYYISMCYHWGFCYVWSSCHVSQHFFYGQAVFRAFYALGGAARPIFVRHGPWHMDATSTLEICVFDFCRFCAIQNATVMMVILLLNCWENNYYNPNADLFAEAILVLGPGLGQSTDRKRPWHCRRSMPRAGRRARARWPGSCKIPRCQGGAHRFGGLQNCPNRKTIQIYPNTFNPFSILFHYPFHTK